MRPPIAAAMIRVVFAAIVAVFLVSCSSRPPADYSQATMSQCEALGDHWPYIVTAEENRCVDTVFQRDSDQAEQKQLDFEKSQAANLKAICNDNPSSCHDLCEVTPEDPTCVAFRQQEARKEIETDCTVLWDRSDLLKGKVNDPICQAARNRATAKARADAAKAKAVAEGKGAEAPFSN